MRDVRVELHLARAGETVEAYERLLVEDGLMLRYRHKDDFGDTTSASVSSSART